jgi:hypothetical protein
MVVGVDGSRVRVAKEGMGRDAQALTWSPDGRWLLYVAEADEPAYQVWDGKAGLRVDLRQEVLGFPTDVESFPDIEWSPQGSRLLLRGPSDAYPGVWVLDMETRRVWQVSDRAVLAALWVDDETILFEARGEGVSDHLGMVDIGPPAQELTETLGLTGGILGVPYALSPDRRYLARLDESDPLGPRLELAPLPGHPDLTGATQLLGQGALFNAVDGALHWSPDSRWIAYNAKASASSEEQDAYTVLIDTTAIGKTETEDSLEEDFSNQFPLTVRLRPSAWSPDSRVLAGLACSEVGCRLNVLDLVLDQVTTVASGEPLQLWDLAWSPGGAYLAYSLTGPDGESTGLMLWDRGTGDHIRLLPTIGMHPFTDLQWTPDACRLYVAQRDDTGQSDLSVAAIWGLGPDWEARWQVAPGSSESSRDGEPQPCPAPPLAGRRLIAYYGTPLGPGLGVLGRHDISNTLKLLNEQAEVYRSLDPGVETIPVFHMVTTVADDFPGPDGDYNHRVPQELIRPWIDAVEAAGGWSVLDVQPGRAHLDAEWDAVEPLLLERTVHLAVDPEFIVADGEVPGHDLGRITGPQVNDVQARLDRVGRTIGHRKMLIIHQFDDRMIRQKAMILDYPFVELVWDADGFGGPGAKIADYNQYRLETGFEHGGFKLFYNEDNPLMTPDQVLALEPPPSVVIYQ